MSQENSSIQIDTDWKKQAQEEKRRLAEQQKAKESSPTTAAPATGASAAARPTTGGAKSARELPEASFASLVQGIVTQSLYYLGDLAPRGSEPVVNLDMAKHNIDTLTVIEQKTKNNLTEEEQRILDAALYEVRMRYVSVASQYIS